MSDKLHMLLWILIAAMNVIAFAVMGIDKGIAVSNGNSGRDLRRVPEKVLFLLALLFGGLGATLGMYSFRHKTKHWYFALGFPLIAIAQIALLVWLNFFG